MNDKELFIAQMLFEKCDRVSDILELQDGDFEYAKKIYNGCYINHEYYRTKWNEAIHEALNGEYEFESDEV